MSTENVLDAIWILPALPLLGAAVLIFFGKRIGEPLAGWIATALMGLAFVWAAVEFFALQSLEAEERAHVSTLWSWIPVGGLQVEFGFLVDPLSIVFALFITFVGTLIHLYAIGYMHGDPRFSRFFAYLNLFAGSMLILVLGSNFLVTFLGWEGVGLCSYLLISFWFEKHSAAVAGKKAFVTNRVGDVGFMLAMFLVFASLGTLDYVAVPEGARGIAAGTATGIALLLMLGAMGKSAQFPLHIWLPDAMEGPTPVSALIHAATMVTAGVFLMFRAAPFLEASTWASDAVAWIGVFTAFFAATAALVQNDIKRTLAYSTISQLGYCFLAIGVGGYIAAIFHVVTHAFFKALLFLGAGSVKHGMHGPAQARGFDEQDMRYMGGLRKLMPITAGTFIVGWLAIAGVPPFAGFFSKDEILAKAWSADLFGSGPLLWAIGLVTALLTAFYMTRQVRMVFYGEPRWKEDGAPEPHESPAIMTVPLVVLAVGATLAGVVNLPFARFESLGKWLEPSLEGVSLKAAPLLTETTPLVLAIVSVLVAAFGIAVGIAVYRNGIPAPDRDPVPQRLGVLAPFFAAAWYVNAAVAWTVSKVAQPAASGLAWFDKRVIDGAVEGTGRTVRLGGLELRRVETGLVRNYALGITAGVVVLFIYVIVRVA